MTIGYGCCVGSWDRFNQYVAPRAQGKIFAVSGYDSIAGAYNSILEAARGQHLDALILQHDDLEITDPNAEAKFLEVLQDEGVGLVGVAGARHVETLAWWNGETIGHQQIETQMIDFGTRSGNVDALEGSIIVLSPWAIVSLRFPPVAGFHGYDVMISRQVRRRSKRVVVADVDTFHHTRLGFRSQASHNEWLEADRIFQASR